MTTVTEPDERTLYSVSEIKDSLSPMLANSKASAAYAYGRYVRADRNGDLRRTDELGIVIIADVAGNHQERKREFTYILDCLNKLEVYPILKVYPPTVIRKNAEDFMDRVADDWEKIYG